MSEKGLTPEQVRQVLEERKRRRKWKRHNDRLRKNDEVMCREFERTIRDLDKEIEEQLRIRNCLNKLPI